VHDAAQLRSIHRQFWFCRQVVDDVVPEQFSKQVRLVAFHEQPVDALQLLSLPCVMHALEQFEDAVHRQVGVDWQAAREALAAHTS
jgi:hypothetical protein